MTRKWKMIIHALGFFVALLFYGALHYCYNLITTDTRDPVQFLGAEAINSPLRVGEKLKVVIYRNKIRDDCPVTSIRSVQTRDGRLIPLAGQIWEGGPIGEYLAFEYDTSNLDAGEYTLKVDLKYDCPKDIEFFHHQPDVTFRILGDKQ